MKPPDLFPFKLCLNLERRLVNCKVVAAGEWGGGLIICYRNSNTRKIILLLYTSFLLLQTHMTCLTANAGLWVNSWGGGSGVPPSVCLSFGTLLDKGPIIPTRIWAVTSSPVEMIVRKTWKCYNYSWILI